MVTKNKFEGHNSVLPEALCQKIVDMPKVELHRHLEGSVRTETLLDVAVEYGIELPGYRVEDLRPYVQLMADEPRNMKQFLSKFDALRQFYRSPEVVKRITREVIMDAMRDNIKYMELRFTPRALTNITKHSFEEAIQWVCEATQQANKVLDIEVRLIASINRHEPVHIGEAVLEAVLAQPDQVIVGVDLAGREEGYSALPFVDIFKQAKSQGLGVTIHAGEWEGSNSIWEAVSDVGADRVGHGVRVLEDEGVLNVIRNRNITLEICPTSNVDSGVFSSLLEHPLPALVESGAWTTINTDDPQISDITLSDELIRAMEYMSFSFDDIKTQTMQAMQATFLPAEEKAVWLEQFQTWLDEL